MEFEFQKATRSGKGESMAMNDEDVEISGHIQKGLLKAKMAFEKHFDKQGWDVTVRLKLLARRCTDDGSKWVDFVIDDLPIPVKEELED